MKTNIPAFLFCISAFAAAAQEPPQNRVGVVLSGGAARGFAHLGALQALEENGIIPSYVAGASMGAIIGSIYASGMPPVDIYKFARKQKYFHLIAPAGIVGQGGLFKATFIHEMLDELIGHCRFELLKKKMFVGVTNLDLARSEIVDTGCLKAAVSASAAIPMIFEPVQMNGYTYVDGGILNNLPVDPLLQIADCRYIIGISVMSTPANSTKWKGLQPALRTFDIMVKNTEVEARKKCHFFVEIEGASAFRLADFKQIDTLYKIGYDAMSRYIAETPDLQELGGHSVIK